MTLAGPYSDSFSPAIAAKPVRLQPLFQPIADLQSGAVVAFEALARFAIGGATLSPAQVLPHLDRGDHIALFGRMVEHAIALTKRPWWPSNDAYVAVNVAASLVASEGFVDLLEHLLDRCEGVPARLVIELLENERIDDHARMATILTRLRRLGVGVALDDVGSAYSSLINLQQLPVDIVKLDQSFAINLLHRPEDLQFIHTVNGLARRLGKKLVIEGVETADALDALTILGVALAQGYAIARPMAPDSIEGWLAERRWSRSDGVPRSILGAYASHLLVVDTCRMLQLQPLQLTWKQSARNWHACKIGRFFSRESLHQTSLGAAHQRFHDVIACFDADRQGWEAAAKDFHDQLVAAVTSAASRRRQIA